MFKFFRKPATSALPGNPRNARSAAVAATTPTVPPGGNLDRNALKVAMKYREDNNLSSGYEPLSLGGFWDSVSSLAKKAESFGKEVNKAGKVLKEVNRLVKPSKGTSFTPAAPSVVVKPATASYDGPTSGIPLGSGIPEPQIANMTATDTRAASPIKSYLLPVSIGAAAVGLFLLVTRKK